MKPFRKLISDSWWVILLALGAATVLLGPWVPKLRVHAGTSVLLGENDPDLAYYESTRPLWGYDEYAIVCVTRDDWINPEGAALLEGLVKDLEAIRHVRPVVSLLDVPLLRQEPGRFINPATVKTLDDEGVNFELAREELIDHTQAKGNLISADGRSLSILVYLDIPPEAIELDKMWSGLRGRRLTDPEAAQEMERLQPERDAAVAEYAKRRIEMVAGVRKVAAAWEQKLGEPVRLSGISVINTNIKEHLNADLRTFSIVSLLIFILAFLVMYRKARFVWMPIVTCLLPVVLVVGAMSWIGATVTLITANLPLLLFTLVLPYAVYFIEAYRERRSLAPDEPGEDSTAHAASRIWLPCLFSCTTTMAGFAALLTSDTRPVHDFGFYMVIGMGAGLIIVFLAIPAMSRPLPPMTIASAGVKAGPTKVVRLFERAALGSPGLVVLATGIVLAVAIWGASRISAQSKVTEYFKSDSEVYLGLEYIDKEMGGTTPLEIMIESDEEGFFLKQEGLDALAAAGRFFDGLKEAGSVRSLKTMVDELKKKNEHIVPVLPFLAKQDMVRNVTREFANEDYTISRVLIRLRETSPTLDRDVILRDLRAYLKAQPELEGLKVRETGVFLLYNNMLNSLVRTQKRTFLYVVLAIFLMLLVLFRSVPLAILVLLPQVLPAIATLGAMGWMGIPLDLITVVIASIAMGIGIDASIQYTFRFRAELEVDGDPRAALTRTHATIGRAIWIATSVIIAGFLILVLSEFRPSIWFGLFTAIAMLISQVAALTTLPSLFLLTGQPKARKTSP